jgi:hypothetical protein
MYVTYVDEDLLIIIRDGSGVPEVLVFRKLGWTHPEMTITQVI